MAFKVGDHVVCVREYERVHSADFGIIVLILKSGFPKIGVQWERYVSGHSCDGQAKKGHGFFVPEECIEYLEESKDSNLDLDVDLI